ncbi:MAG: hypothetical protein K9N47_21005 [Prosthecobacter sp.]|uniref:FN3 associated domain-containing protein n=1 Tax=Prosthecobacter sp. TaxID=1965333 RepID=UPI00260548B1|nr:FN3 associated domain-containing protein [Prosthecobacter sp.]MCF7788615.1 hypothetical protein [Prosthecobacter sp.]
MPALSSPLERLQSDIEQCLLSLAVINMVSITAVRPRNAGAAAQIQTKINNTLAGLEARNGKRGTAVIVGMPMLANVNPAMYGVQGDIMIELRVIENILVNEGADGTGFTAESLAYLIAQMIPQMNFAPFGQLIADKSLITPVPEAVMEKRIEYRVRLKVTSHARPYDKCQPPVITSGGGNVTLSGSGEIWYTTDESYPGPGNAEAVLYTAPFAQPSGMLRAAAHAADKMASDVVSQSF